MATRGIALDSEAAAAPTSTNLRYDVKDCAYVACPTNGPILPTKFPEMLSGNQPPPTAPHVPKSSPPFVGQGNLYGVSVCDKIRPVESSTTSFPDACCTSCIGLENATTTDPGKQSLHGTKVYW